MTTIETLLELKTRLDELSLLVKKIDQLVLVLSPQPKKEKKVKETSPEPKEKKPRKVKIVIPTEEVKDATV
jgi:hypothetical protein